MELLNRLNKPKATPTKEADSQPPLEDMEVNQERPDNIKRNQAEEVK